MKFHHRQPAIAETARSRRIIQIGLGLIWFVAGCPDQTPIRESKPSAVEKSFQGAPLVSSPSIETADSSAPILDPAELEPAAELPPPADIAVEEPNPDYSIQWDDRPRGKEGNILVTFGDLGSFEYWPPFKPAEATAEGTPVNPRDTQGQIPGYIFEIDGRTIAVSGFMIPMDVQTDGVHSFILVADQMSCCFGGMPRMNEWIHVTMAEGQTTDYLMDVPLLVVGEIDVGEEWSEGMVMSLYRMTATKVQVLVGGDGLTMRRF